MHPSVIALFSRMYANQGIKMVWENKAWVATRDGFKGVDGDPHIAVKELKEVERLSKTAAFTSTI
jgi:hypothetical protein